MAPVQSTLLGALALAGSASAFVQPTLNFKGVQTARSNDVRMAGESRGGAWIGCALLCR